MSPLLIAIVATLLMVALFLLGLPLGISMGTVGVLGLLWLRGPEAAGTFSAMMALSQTASYSLSVVPMFVLMGFFAAHSGISKNIFTAARAWFSRIPGGLAVATVMGCAAFGAVCGTSVAGAAAMGKICLPEMERHGYQKELAAGTVAAGGTLSALIPPSVGMVLYGIFTQQSVGRLLIAGIIPGLLSAVFFSLIIMFRVMKNPKLAGDPPPATTLLQKIISLKESSGVLALAVLVIGGIYGGFFSPSEAASVGAVGAFLWGIALRRLNINGIKASLMDSMRTTGSVFLIILGAVIFAAFIGQTGATLKLIDYIGDLKMNPYLILLGFSILYLILGCLMEAIGIMLMTLPFIFPIIVRLGFDPIWFGVFQSMFIEIGFLTPPVGMNVFVIRNVAPHLSLNQIFRGCYPFVIAYLAVTILLVIFPGIATWLPNTMLGK
jgi:C4-dicarboxylate transporter, DctM subunit